MNHDLVPVYRWIDGNVDWKSTGSMTTTR